MRPRKPYKTLDEVPLGRWNLIVICLRRGYKHKAGQMLDETLAKVKDIPVFEAFQLAQKLMKEAGV
jgi:hypothetical protein